MKDRTELRQREQIVGAGEAVSRGRCEYDVIVVGYGDEFSIRDGFVELHAVPVREGFLRRVLPTVGGCRFVVDGLSPMIDKVNEELDRGALDDGDH